MIYDLLRWQVADQVGCYKYRLTLLFAGLYNCVVPFAVHLFVGANELRTLHLSILQALSILFLAY
jgi:hypothetical protein